MNKDYSDQALRDHCPHCDRNSFAYEFLLEEYPLFSVTCDAHPLREGHLLIIPKRHVSCIGEYTQAELAAFKEIYERVSTWIEKHYGAVATFEHGKIGQTVFHSHVHLLPFSGEPLQILPEGADRMCPLSVLDELLPLFQKKGGYLYFSLGPHMWIVDPALGQPRFFRDRFARALGRGERANWKATRQNPALLQAGREENQRCSKLFLQ